MSLRDCFIEAATDRLIEAGISPSEAIIRAEAACQRESPWFQRAVELPSPGRPAYLVIDGEKN
jgi:hypothetical protein